MRSKLFRQMRNAVSHFVQQMDDLVEFKKVSKINCLAAIAITFILMPLNTYYYRPFINSNAINDFGIAGSINSYLACISIVFIHIYTAKLQPSMTIVWATTLGYIIYECLQPTLRLGIFDISDVIAIILGGLTALALLLLNNRYCHQAQKELPILKN